MLRVYYILSYNFAHSIMGWDSMAPRQWTFGRFFFVIRRRYSLHFVWNLNFIPRNKNSRSYFTWMHKTWKHINSMWNLFKILNNFLRSQLYWVNAFNAHVCVPMHMVRWYIQCIFVSIIQSQRFIQFSFHTIDTRTAHTIKLLPSVPIFCTSVTATSTTTSSSSSYWNRICLLFRRDRLRVFDYTSHTCNAWKVCNEWEHASHVYQAYTFTIVKIQWIRSFVRSFAHSFGVFFCMLLINLRRQRITIIHTITASWIPWNSSCFFSLASHAFPWQHWSSLFTSISSMCSKNQGKLRERESWPEGKISML